MPRRRPFSERWVGVLFVLPAFVAFAVFVLQPFFLSVQYSLYDWDGIGPANWVGLENYVRVFTDSELYGAIINAFKLIVFFSVIPVALGLVAASVTRRVASGWFGSMSRTLLFLPQIIPLVASGIMWRWMLAERGLVNQILSMLGLDDATRAWLGDFDFALPAVGLIGIWALFGFCSILLLSGMSKIDPALYESARLDGAGAFREFRSITLPLLRHEIGVCVTVTVVAALAAFDIVYVATQGGPGHTTMVPGLKVYFLAFTTRDVGTASAMAVVLVAVVLVAVLPLQSLFRERER
ncbi:MAG: sugar ABC transporter permease [Acidimicrobiia bacterium]